MHKKYLAFGLPVLGALAVVGSGFSAWAFGGTTVTGSATISVAVTEEATYGSISTTSSEGISLVLDQGGEAQKSNLDYGIHFKKTSDSSVVTSLGASYTVSKTQVVTLLAAGFNSYTMKTEVKLSSVLDDYVTFADSLLSSVTAATDSTEITYTVSSSSATSISNLSYDESDNYTASLPSVDVTSTAAGTSSDPLYHANKLLKYSALSYSSDETVTQTGGKPQNSTFYNTMKNALTNGSNLMTVNYTVEFSTTIVGTSSSEG